MSNKIDLQGRIAVVTGGAQGIGYAVASRLAESGASLALWDRDAAVLAEAVTSLGAARRKLFRSLSSSLMRRRSQPPPQQTEKALGRIDILVNNAGISGPTMPVVDYPLDEWRRIIDIDLNGVFYCCKAVVPGMIPRGYGRIVNVASIAGKEGNPNAAAYSAAKAGVIALTKSLGKELAAQRHRGELRDAGRGEDEDLRPDQPAAHRLHAFKDPAGPLPQGRGSRRHDRVPGPRGQFLHHRRGVRPLRRTRDLLKVDDWQYDVARP